MCKITFMFIMQDSRHTHTKWKNKDDKEGAILRLKEMPGTQLSAPVCPTLETPRRRDHHPASYCK